MGKAENELNAALMLTASERGWRLWRNNSGVAFHKDGSVVAYGVASPGGSDLLGFTQIEVTPDMVGRTLAVFTAVEVKTGNKNPTEDQDKFLRMVREKGGIAVVGRDHDMVVWELAAWKPAPL